MNEQEKKVHVDMMASPGRWPCWPWLPLKRRSGQVWPECGLLRAVNDKLTEVVLGVNMWDGDLKAAVENAEKRMYDSFEAIVNDGWEVD